MHGMIFNDIVQNFAHIYYFLHIYFCTLQIGVCSIDGALNNG